jgi:hypothetical protein
MKLRCNLGRLGAGSLGLKTKALRLSVNDLECKSNICISECSLIACLVVPKCNVAQKITSIDAVPLALRGLMSEYPGFRFVSLHETTLHTWAIEMSVRWT